jgi:hypothetical protein
LHQLPERVRDRACVIQLVDPARERAGWRDLLRALGYA